MYILTYLKYLVFYILDVGQGKLKTILETGCIINNIINILL